jgi:single-strand DNA-binding protein
MASFNKVILMGNLTRDVELRYLPSGMAVAEIGLAVNDRRKNQQGEWVDETTFVDVTLWSRQAEIAGEYLSKGSPVLIEGRLKLDQWEKDGQKRSKLKVVGENMRMLGGKGGGGGGRSAPSGDAGEYGGDEGSYEGGSQGRPQQQGSRPAPRGNTGGAPQRSGGGGGGEDDIPF